MVKCAAYDRLVENGIKPTAQRIAIMRYLMGHETHPTVDEVYRKLCGRMPTLSRTTVYNTLRMFSDHNAARMITIDEHRVCYDGNISPHTHFYCKRCKRIIDIFDNAESVSPVGVGGNRVDDIHLYYRGVCEACLRKESERET